MKSLKRLYFLSPLILAIALALGVWIGYSWLSPSKSDDANKKFREIMSIVDREYVDDINTDSVLDLALPDLLSYLDPHSIYIPAADFAAVNNQLEGSFSGIGVTFNMMTDTIKVIEVLSGGPSEKVGILPGDRIVTIDDSVVAGKKISDENIISRLRGPKGTKVRLGVERVSSKRTLKFEVVRDDIPMVSIDAAYMLSGNIGYIRVNKFSKTTYNEFLTDLNRLTNKGAKSFVLDFRGNGGGLLDVAILMVNEFLPAGSPIVSTRGRIENTQTLADGSGNFQNTKVAVLIDEFSASASEIFAGAIQDNDRGIIIGRRSFGKGLVQKQTILSDSSAIRLTVARYYTPSGRCIQKKYVPGKSFEYEGEVFKRFDDGESFKLDSTKINKDEIYQTVGGRPVYGGGGIIPDIFVPVDTAGVTKYYVNVYNSGMFQKFTFDFCDMNRQQLSKIKQVDALINNLPSDGLLIQSFVEYAAQRGHTPRWYYINQSSELIINTLQSLIARDMLGTAAYYEVANSRDKMIKSAVEAIKEGRADFPIRQL